MLFTTHKCNVFYYLLNLTRLFFPYFLANPPKPSTFAPLSMLEWWNGRHEGLKIPWPLSAVRVRVPLRALAHKDSQKPSLKWLALDF